MNLHGGISRRAFIKTIIKKEEAAQRNAAIINMKHTINQEMVMDISAKLNVIADKDAKALFSFGAKALGDDKELCGLRLTTAHEQLMMQFAAPKPEGYEGKADEILVNASKFAAVLASLNSLKSDVFVDIRDNICIVGVDGKAQVPVPLLAEGTEQMKPGQVMFNIQVSTKDFLPFLKKGLMCSDEANSDRGLNNSMMSVNTETGLLTGFSTDGYIVGFSETKAALAPGKNSDAEAAALAAYLEGRETKDVPVLLPRQTVEHLRVFMQGIESFRLSVTDKHVVACLGNSAIYISVQGATMPIGIPQVRKIMDAEPEARASLDNGELDKCLSFVNAMNDTINDKPSLPPMKISLGDGFIKAESGLNGTLASRAKAAASEGAADLSVNGKLAKIALSYLGKGGVIIGFVKNNNNGVLTLSNGNLATGEDGSGKLALIGLKMPETVEETTEATAE